LTRNLIQKTRNNITGPKMNIVSVTELLARPDYGLDAPTLNVLVADANNYSGILLQPQARIEADQSGIRNRDRTLATALFRDFLEKAMNSGADLVVTPEYSTPWNVLREAINGADKGPASGKLWALGCESIRYSELQQFKDEISEHATVIFEEMPPDNSRVVDPLAYVFRTSESQGNGQQILVVLVQFKTHAMEDGRDFERNLLQLGTDVYQFGTYGAGISLTSLICADAFAVRDEIAQQIYDRALILHIQLNPDPRHQIFLGCRARLLGCFGDSTEIICLNWARNVEFWVNHQHKKWGNISGSAWYGKMQEFDAADTTLSQNHRMGLYYTNLKPHRAHTLFFNFNPAIFRIEASKVVRLGSFGPAGLRKGPRLTEVLNWFDENQAWAAIESSDDGFLAIANNSGDAAVQVKNVFDLCPLACERLLALCAGKADSSLKWFRPDELDSFLLDQREVINRITFCQDNSPDVAEFRNRRLSRCAQLWRILQTHQLPATLEAGENGFELLWTLDAPHQNLRCAGGERATVMYLGEETDEATITCTYKSARERIRLSMNEEVADRAKFRVVLWYRDMNGNIQCRWDPPVIDRQRDESEYDFGRMS
jgi:hypothetical protein